MQTADESSLQNTLDVRVSAASAVLLRQIIKDAYDLHPSDPKLEIVSTKITFNDEADEVRRR